MKNYILLLFIPIVCFGQEDIDYSSENSAKKYFDDYGAEFIEGIWQPYSRYLDLERFEDGNEFAGQSANYFKFVIIKKDDKFIGRVLSSVDKEDYWSSGEIGLVLETTASKDVISVSENVPPNFTEYLKKTQWDAIGLLKSNTILEYIYHTGTRLGRCERKLIKTYPSFVKQKKTKAREWAGNGSGIVISKSGHIVTNNHVIEDADNIEIEIISNGEIQKFNAEVVQKDLRNDLAVLKIVDVDFDGFSAINYNFKTRSSDVGTKIYTFGYPKALSGMGKEIKITEGIISSKSGIMGDITTYQITAPIQGGNSGGPLFDDKGNLIGINSSRFKSDETENVNYSIKSSYVLNLIDVLPKSIDLPSSTKLQSLPLTEQIKEISKYVVLVKVK